MPIDIDSFVNELERRRAIPLDCDDCGQTVGQQAIDGRTGCELLKRRQVRFLVGNLRFRESFAPESKIVDSRPLNPPFEDDGGKRYRKQMPKYP